MRRWLPDVVTLVLLVVVVVVVTAVPPQRTDLLQTNAPEEPAAVDTVEGRSRRQVAEEDPGNAESNVPPPPPSVPPPPPRSPDRTNLVDRQGPAKPALRPRPPARQDEGRRGRQESEPIPEDSELCDFGSSPTQSLCDWTNLEVTQLKWHPSTGESAFWLGGPGVDVSYGDSQGGYAVFETSQIPQRVAGQSIFESAMLMSPLKESTGPKGMCVKFWYSIAGLSPDKIRVLLHPMAENISVGMPVDEVMQGYDGSEDVVLWEARDMTNGEWKEGQIVYTYGKKHSVIFEAIPVDSGNSNRRFRGYVAVDELSFTDSKECGAFCTFEGGTCGWTQDSNDDFDWTLSRGSLNPSTGPPRDRSSFANEGLLGGYAYIDTGFPRRPGDVARLMSQEFQGTNPDGPLCMRFWIHMYGNGIGSLRVLIYDVNTAQDTVIWKISGEAGNAWYQGQVPISSSSPFKVSPDSVELPTFKIVFEGQVGANNLGDIAIDDISIIQGACPSAPQVAAGQIGDCTFEVDECGWASPGPRERLDEMDWVRTVAADNRAPARDHTLGTVQGFYMTLPRGTVQRGGDRAWLVSPTMKGSGDPMCLAFWYFMYEPFIDPSGPSLGSLLVHERYESAEGDIVTRPLWSLKNHQGPNWMYGQAKLQNERDFVVVFEGMWGSSRANGFMALDDITVFRGDCTTMPRKGSTSGGDCSFQHNTCQWKNITSDSDFRWTTASISRRPANLPDHTFGGPIGYAYFDVFNQNARPQTLSLLSPPLDKSDDNAPVCLSFWYAYFGASDTTRLKVVRESYDRAAEEEDQRFSGSIVLWELVGNLGRQRPEWQFGQVEVDASTDHRISMVGMASNGGFAIDDIKIFPGSCSLRPEAADPAMGATTDELPVDV